MLVALIVAAWCLWAALPLLAGANRSEDLGLASFWSMVFTAAAPLALLASYLGGRAGGLLRIRDAAG